MEFILSGSVEPARINATRLYSISCLLLWSMPRVLRIFNRLILGGPLFNVTYLTKFLAPEFETRLLIGAKDPHEEEAHFIREQYQLNPIEISCLKRNIHLGDDTRAFREIKKIIEEYRPHIVHTHAAKPGAIGRLAASVCKVPVIVHTYHGHVFHSYFGKAKTQFFIQAERYLATKTDRIIAISDQQKTELVDTFRICKPEKMTVIPLGLDLRKFYEDQEQKRIVFRKKLGISDDELAIGIVGRVVPIKNHKLFIDAIQEVLSKTSRKVRFIIVGDGDMRESLFSLLDQYLIPYNYLPEQTQPAQVTFTSWLTEMDEVYAGLDIVALTSLNEGTPVSLIEAQAANKPIVSTRVGGVEDVVIENKTALLCPSEQVSPFSDALLRLTENDHLRHQMGQFGNQHVKDRFDKDRLVSDVRSLYHQLLAEKNVPH